MASIVKEILIDQPAEAVWDAVADFGGVHRRFAPGFVTDAMLDGEARIVTFADGLVAREVLLGVDPTRRRLAYFVDGKRLTHHNAAFQVLPEGEQRCRLVWTVDLLPDALADYMAGRMDTGLAIAQATLGRVPA